MAGQRVDPLADDDNVAMAGDRSSHLGRECLAIDRQRRSGGNPMLVGRAHNQRAKRPHLLVQQSDCIVLGIVGPEAVGADHLG